MANRLSTGPFQVRDITVEELNYQFMRVRQELDELKGLRGPIELHDTITGLTLADTQLTLTDNTTNNVNSSRHGFAPKSPADATKFLNGATTPAYAQVKDSDLSLTDITTNDVTSAKHGFAPKSPADAAKFLNGAATPAFALVKDSDLSTSDITTNNVSTSKHGFTPKLPNDATKYLDGTGAYTVPSGSGGSLTVKEVDGSPSVSSVATIRVTNGTLTDDGGGQVTISTSGSSGVGRPVDPTTTSFVKDDFLTGSTTSGTIGELRWNVSSGVGTTQANVAAESGRPGIKGLQVTTSAVGAFDITNAQSIFHVADTWNIYYMVRLPALTNRHCRIGIFDSGSSFTADPPADGIYLEYINGTDTNWQGVTRAASTETRTDTGIAVAANTWHRLNLYRKNSTTIGFVVDSGSEVTSTTNIFSGSAIPVFQLKSLSGTVTSQIDYYDCLITGLSR